MRIHRLVNTLRLFYTSAIPSTVAVIPIYGEVEMSAASS
jgi:hypothetical protein